MVLYFLKILCSVQTLIKDFENIVFSAFFMQLFIAIMFKDTIERYRDNFCQEDDLKHV